MRVLTRQKILLSLLSGAKKPLNSTVFVKLVFLLRHETELESDRTFYDFVPYKFGPFSFAMYRELSSLQRYGYVMRENERVALVGQMSNLIKEKVQQLTMSAQQSVNIVLRQYGKMSQTALVKGVYAKYPWYAIRSELSDLKPARSRRLKRCSKAVYTAGYEGKSVDYFFNSLLKRGIELIIDVRANAISRRYGFSKQQFGEIAGRLKLGYQHLPSLGIPRTNRYNLNDDISYKRLLDKYEREMLPKHEEEIEQVGYLMQGSPAVLVCFEKDIEHCHRSRLAIAVARKTGLDISHL